MSNNNTSLQQPSDTKNTSTPTVVHSLSSSRESTSPPQQLVQPELSSSTYLHSPSPLAKRSHIEYFQSTPQPPENAASETLDSDAVSLFFRTSPRVTPAGTSTTSNYNRFPIPSPRPNLTSHINPLSPPAPQPKYNMASPDQHPQGYLPPHPHAHPALPHPLAHGHPAHPHTKGKEVEIQHPNEMAAPSKHGHGVEMVLKASETAAQNERGQVHTTGHGHHDYFKSTVGARPPPTNTGVSGTTSTMGHGYGPQGQQGQPVNNNKLTQDDGKGTSPPRKQKNTEVAFVITPGDMTKPGETPRRPAPRQQHGYEVPNVPESPYGAYPSPYGQPHPHPGYYHPHGYYHPPQSPVKSSKPTPAEEAGEHGGGYPHPPPPYGYPPPYAYGYDRYYPEDPYRADIAGAHPHSPGKRQRANDDNDSKSKGGASQGQAMSVSERDRERGREPEEGHDYSVPPPAYRFPPTRPYYERGPPPHPGYPYYNPAVSESFDSGERSGDRSADSKRSPPRRTAPGPPPPVSKASSYPPPTSPPGRYGTGPQGDASASTYPGARRARGHHGERPGSGYSYDNAGIYSRGAPPHHGGPGELSRYYPSGQGRYEDGHAPPGPPSSEGYYGREPGRGYPPPGFYGGGEGEYYHRPGPPGLPLPGAQEDVHPLLRDERSRSHPLPSGDDNRTHTSHSSPPRRKRADGSVNSRDMSSPNKPKPSTAAQAAIAAGMTEPASAKEVDFDITDPPRDPFTPPSAKPLCSQSSDINIHDVLCGRGGGTNTQVGNRRFRSLVQEFQPTYLLCRRKEKPLIARTIVLIIRNRRGRFLKKNEDDGGFYEVGDEKAEAKTSQALREGLDVRASRSTMDGKKKNRRKKKATSSNDSATESMATTVKSPARLKKEDNDVNMEPPTPQRDGPPPHHDAYPHYPPPGFYYGYGAGAGGGAGDGYYPPPYGAMNYQMAGGGGQYSPSRKRARAPHASGESSYEYQQFPPPSSYKNYMYPYPPDYPNHGPPPGANDAEHEEGGNSMWEDFSPPRPMVKKQQDVESNPTGEE